MAGVDVKTVKTRNMRIGGQIIVNGSQMREY